MPGREELLAQLLGLLQSPLTRLARALKSPLNNLVSVLKQLEEKGK
jgi:ribosomal protein L10